MNFREFVKYVLIVVISTIATLGTIVFLFFLSMSAVFMSMEKSLDKDDSKAKISHNSILELRLDYPIKEKMDNPFENFDLSSFKFRPALTLHQIIQVIEKAAEDSKIKGLLIHPGMIQAGYASTEEIRQAIERFKESEKPVWSYSEMYGQKAYYLATEGNDIMLDKMGFMEWKGLAATLLFYKNLLDKLGIKMQVLRHGKFKSAVEPFIQDRMSEENRHQLKELLFDIWQEVISKVQKVDESTLQNVANELPYSVPEEWKEGGFVDKVIDNFDQLKEMLAEETGMEAKELRFINETDYYYKTKIQKLFEAPFKNDIIAVLVAEGEIIDGEGEENQIGGDKMARLINKLRKDDDIKAVVLRINSPGGSAMASEKIWRELKKLTQEKPLVVSMGDVAASGGYYIASPAKKIVVSPYTITGSIGVFGLIPDISDLMEEKLHINMDTVKTNPHADMGILRPMDEKEREYLQKTVEHVYAIFLERVSEGRNMTPAEVDSIGQGRVWSGKRAVELGLADYEGTVKDAIELAADMADMEDYDIRYYPKTDNPLAELFALKSSDMESKLKSRILKQLTGIDFNVNYQQFKNRKNRIMARMPYDIKISN